MDKILAVFDSDTVYATRFMEYFKRRNDLHFELSIFTKMESLEEFLDQHLIEILLVGGNISLETIPKDRIKNIIILTEDIRQDKELEYRQIFKYQSARTVIEEILNDYKKKELKTIKEKQSGKSRIITIFSLRPDEIKAAFAWTVSYQMSLHDKILFIPLTMFPVPLISQADSSVHAVSEFIYHLKENNPNLLAKMNELTGFIENLSYLSGITHGFDLLSLGKEDMGRWVEELKGRSDYSDIVFYLSFYSEAGMELMLASDRLLISHTEDFYEKAMLKEWFRQMELFGFSGENPRLQMISLPEENLTFGKGISVQQLQNSPLWELASQYTNGIREAERIND